MVDSVDKGGRPRNWRRALLRTLQLNEPEITDALVRKARLGDPVAAHACISLLDELERPGKGAGFRTSLPHLTGENR